jgi:PAS domain S-box-containing protein
MTENLILTVERARERVEMRRESKKLEAALAASEKTHREVVENVQALIVGVDDALSIRFVNRASLEITGWNPEGLIGRSLSSLLVLHGESEAERRELIQRAIDRENEPQEIDLLHLDGSVRHLLWRWARPSQANHGQRLIYGIGTDLTQLRAAQVQARVAEKLAAVGRLTAGLAHEIKNPLNAAILQLSLLARLIHQLSDREQERLGSPLELVRGELRRLDGLLEDFLAFARPREYRKNAVRLSVVAEDVVRLNQERAAGLGRTLELLVRDDCQVLGDANALRQVVVNLVNNALDAAKNKVRVVIRRDGARAVLDVEDDGPGIPQDVMARIFEPFFTTKPTGTGLGTAIVHTLVSSHGGQVSYLSPPGVGTVATVVLPVGSTTLS